LLDSLTGKEALGSQGTRFYFRPGWEWREEENRLSLNKGKSMVIIIVALVAVLALQQYLSYLTLARWQRMFAERQGIPVSVMENKPLVKVPLAPKDDKRHRISIPIPGGQGFRKAE
jgi:hypothetical protein